MYELQPYSTDCYARLRGEKILGHNVAGPWGSFASELDPAPVMLVTSGGGWPKFWTGSLVFYLQSAPNLDHLSPKPLLNAHRLRRTDRS